MEYRVLVPWSAVPGGEQGTGEFERDLDRFRGADELIVERERKGKTQRFDLKQQVPALKLTYGAEAIEVTMRISVRESGFPKPEEVLHALFSLGDEQTKSALITRTDVGLRSTSRKGAGGVRYES
jgi:hypothetical protein